MHPHRLYFSIILRPTGGIFDNFFVVKPWHNGLQKYIFVDNDGSYGRLTAVRERSDNHEQKRYESLKYF